MIACALLGLPDWAWMIMTLIWILAALATAAVALWDYRRR